MNIKICDLCRLINATLKLYTRVVLINRHKLCLDMTSNILTTMKDVVMFKEKFLRSISKKLSP